MKKKIVLGTLALVLTLVVIVFAVQYTQYRKYKDKPISCEGDWSYITKCSFGTYCKDKQPIQGGTCQPYLAPLFDKVAK